MKNKRFADAFYQTQAWKRCRDAYLASKGGLCERCLQRGLIVPGTEVHHVVHLTPENVTDPEIALSWGNLILLCKPCHLEEHHARRWRCDERGHVEL